MSNVEIAACQATGGPERQQHLIYRQIGRRSDQAIPEWFLRFS
ncbi:MAG: hypothetical protein U1G07_01420 [Verrucomicrobiota bacterium]